jgi:Calcineurin-like phosphoesterase
MPSFRQALGSIIIFATFFYLALFLLDPLRHSLWNAPRPHIEYSTRIVAVGDLHGDIGNAQKVLEMARVVDSDGMWSGEVDVFVQTGDIIDRCVYCAVNTGLLTSRPQG